MRKVIVIMMREYQAAVKTKAFIITLILMPIMMGGSIAAQKLLADKVDTQDKKIAVIDFSGKLLDPILTEAEKRNQEAIFKINGAERVQIKPKFLFERVETPAADANIDELDLSLSERVRKKELLAYVTISANVVSGAKPGETVVAYHSNSPTYDDVVDWLSPLINKRVQELRAVEENLSPAVLDKLLQRTSVANLGLVSRDESGVVKKAEKTNEVASFMLPFGLMMLMFMVVMIGASPLVQSVIEEKTNRIVEVLLGSIPPFQLMLGKLLGVVAVSLTIVTVYMVGGFVAMRMSGYGAMFPTHLVWWFIAFQALAVLLFGSLFIAIGAAVTDLREAQSLMTPVTLIVIIPMFVWLNVLKEPQSTFSTVMSLIPPCTPMLMILRQAVPPGVPAWQPILGIILVLITTLACVWAAGRIFRVGILMQGRGAKFGEMIRWVFSG